MEKSRKLAPYCRQVATQAGCHFLDVAEVVVASPVDGVHWDAQQHTLLGKRLAEVVRELMENPVG